MVVRWLFPAADPRPTHGVDVTGEPLDAVSPLWRRMGSTWRAFRAPPRPAHDQGITAMQGRAMGVPNACCSGRDFQAPPPIALEAMRMGQGG